MDLDPAQLRAFLAVTEQHHFGRAAQELAITQQALSKRIARLEATLGERLLDRDGRGAVPTAAGERLIEPARAVLAACAAAVTAVRGSAAPLRLDVWGHLFAPLRTVGAVAVEPGAVETGHGRDLPSVLAALLRGEIDAGLGRHHPLPDGRDRELAHRLVRLEPVDAVVGPDHPLADATSLTPADLRASQLLLPAALVRLEFLQRFAERFELTSLAVESNLGAEHFLAHLAATPTAVTLLPADVPLPAATPGLRTIPLVDPTPSTPGPWSGPSAPPTLASPPCCTPSPKRAGIAAGWSTTRSATGSRRRSPPSCGRPSAEPHVSFRPNLLTSGARRVQNRHLGRAATGG